MITTELRNIQGLVSSSVKLNIGMEFMRLMRTEGLLEADKGLFSAICGGAVRDGLFTGREINDIDIFLFRDSRSPSNTAMFRTSRDIEEAMQEVRQNVLAWMEDMEIEHQSLLSQNAQAYFGGQRFVDIIQFIWNEVTFQIMIPTGGQLQNGVDNLLRTMPIYSGMCLTLEFFRAFDTSVAHMWLPDDHYFVATERDVPYIRHKFPTGRIVPVTNNREAAMIALGDHIRTTTIDILNVNDSVQMNVNSANNMIKRAVCAKWGVVEGVLSSATAQPNNTL